ncbi:MAG: 30S ribosomal protein S15 [Methanosarcinales archaeon]|nr:30S ribosomal protein S15 [Methanosarcinales archaeon]
MARMHSRKKGSSRSRPPAGENVPAWCDISKEELEKVIVRLHDNGLAPAMIGLTLRDQYGVPNAKLILGQSITHFLQGKVTMSEVPEDLSHLMSKALKIRRHLKSNSKDVHNNRALQLTEAKVRRLVRYYRDSRRLPGDWTYKPETAEMLIT